MCRVWLAVLSIALAVAPHEDARYTDKTVAPFASDLVGAPARFGGDGARLVQLFERIPAPLRDAVLQYAEGEGKAKAETRTTNCHLMMLLHPLAFHSCFKRHGSAAANDTAVTRQYEWAVARGNKLGFEYDERVKARDKAAREAREKREKEMEKADNKAERERHGISSSDDEGGWHGHYSSSDDEGGWHGHY